MAVGAPHPALRDVALRYCSYAERTTAFTRRRELPSASVTLVIGFEDPIEVVFDRHAPGRASRCRAFVAGLHDAGVTVDSFGAQSGVQLDLTPLGAHRLLGVPMHELSNSVVELDDVLGAPVRALAGRLQDEPDARRRFDLLDAVLARRLAGAAAPAPAVAWSWQRLRATGGAVPVALLARETGFSRRHLTASFTRQIGLPPRTMGRILRFGRLLEHLEGGVEPRWAELAADCGYYDQAHLNRDVRAFAGTTPSALAASRLPDGGGLRG